MKAPDRIFRFNPVFWLFAFLFLCLVMLSLSCMSTLAPITPAKPPRPINVSPLVTSQTETREAVVVHTPWLNVRSCAGVTCPVIGKLDEGQAVTLTGDCETPEGGVYRWCEIAEPKGWVNTRYLDER